MAEVVKDVETGVEGRPLSGEDEAVCARRRKRNILLADLGVVFVALFWGGGFVAGKFALDEISPLMLNGYRYIGAVAVMLIFCARRLPKMNRKLLLPAGAIGFLMFLGNSLQTVGLQYTTPGKQSFIISLYTVLVPLLSWIILKERPSKKIIAAAVTALFGICLLTLTDDLTIGFGDGLTFIFAVTFSLQVILIAIFMRDFDPLLFTFVQIGSAAVFSIISAFLFEAPASLSGVSWQGLTGLIYLATFNTAFAFLLQNLCQRYAPANHTAIILASETVFGTIFAITLAGEIFTQRMVVGCVLMFLAILITKLPAISRKDRGVRQESGG